MTHCPHCGSPRNNTGQPSRRCFFDCESYHYTGKDELAYMSDMCLVRGDLKTALELLKKVRWEVYNRNHQNDKLMADIGEFLTDHGIQQIPPIYDNSRQAQGGQ